MHGIYFSSGLCPSSAMHTLTTQIGSVFMTWLEHSRLEVQRCFFPVQLKPKNPGKNPSSSASHTAEKLTWFTSKRCPCLEEEILFGKASFSLSIWWGLLWFCVFLPFSNNFWVAAWKALSWRSLLSTQMVTWPTVRRDQVWAIPVWIHYG